MSKRKTPALAKTIFVTGTNTGVGKTVIATLLVKYLRRNGVHALAMKPFCSGGLGDVKHLDAAQNGELPRELLNPFYFQAPLAPLLGARNEGRKITLKAVLQAIRCVKNCCEVLIIEGAGGLLTPLGENYCALDLIREVADLVIVVARNELGVINHARLTVENLPKNKKNKTIVVLTGGNKIDKSSRYNMALLKEMLTISRVFEIPYLSKTKRVKVVKKYTKKK